MMSLQDASGSSAVEVFHPNKNGLLEAGPMISSPAILWDLFWDDHQVTLSKAK